MCQLAEPSIDYIVSKIPHFAFEKFSQADPTRESVIPIELVDGDRLVELFEVKQLGLRRKEVFEVDHSFFEQFR
jgi:restriction system protein